MCLGLLDAKHADELQISVVSAIFVVVCCPFLSISNHLCLLFLPFMFIRSF